MGDVYDPQMDRLDQIAGNLIDVETEQQKTNELLGQVLEELRQLNKGLKATVTYVPLNNQPSGYRCMFCGGWISTPEPHNCQMFGIRIS